MSMFNLHSTPKSTTQNQKNIMHITFQLLLKQHNYWATPHFPTTKVAK